MTQGYLAEVTGFSTSFISNLENGKETCEIGKAIYLVNLLGLDLNVEEREKFDLAYKNARNEIESR